MCCISLVDRLYHCYPKIEVGEGVDLSAKVWMEVSFPYLEERLGAKLVKPTGNGDVKKIFANVV